MRAFIEQYLRDSAVVKQSLSDQAGHIATVVEALVAVSRKGGTLYTCGNGGSACDAMHFAEELVARYRRERPGIRAQHLCDPSAITCWANDYSFAGAFERQVRTMLRPDDALIGFSTSGNSENVVRAVQAANELGALTIALTGKTGGAIASLAKFSIIVPSPDTAHIQEAHMSIVHMVCDLLEQALYPEKS